jgi:hypothetical protein
MGARQPAPTAEEGGESTRVSRVESSERVVVLTAVTSRLLLCTRDRLDGWLAAASVEKPARRAGLTSGQPEGSKHDGESQYCIRAGACVT